MFPKLAERPKRVLATVTALVMGLAACEAALRLLEAASPRVRSAVRPWSIPTRDARYLGGSGELRMGGNPDFVEHDSRGFRNPVALADADIVVLGDSNTYGHSVAPEAAWPAQLAFRLTDAAVYSMAMSGWGPIQFRALLPTARELDPKRIVICIYLGNDPWDAYHMAYNFPLGEDLRDRSKIEAMQEAELRAPLYAQNNGATPSRIDPTLVTPPSTAKRAVATLSEVFSTVALLRALRLAFLGLDRYGGVDLLSDDHRQRNWEAWQDRAEASTGRFYLFDHNGVRTVLTIGLASKLGNDPRGGEGLAVTERWLEGLAVESSAVKYLFVILPTKEHVVEPFVEHLPPVLARGVEWERAASERILRAFDRLDLEFVSMLEPLRDEVRAGRNPYFEDADSHISARGHRVIAECVAAELLNSAC